MPSITRFGVVAHGRYVATFASHDADDVPGDNAVELDGVATKHTIDDPENRETSPEVHGGKGGDDEDARRGKGKESSEKNWKRRPWCSDVAHPV